MLKIIFICALTSLLSSCGINKVDISSCMINSPTCSIDIIDERSDKRVFDNQRIVHTVVPPFDSVIKANVCSKLDNIHIDKDTLITYHITGINFNYVGLAFTCEKNSEIIGYLNFTKNKTVKQYPLRSYIRLDKCIGGGPDEMFPLLIKNLSSEIVSEIAKISKHNSL